MKNKLLFAFLISVTMCKYSYSQVGIGTTTPNGALDVSSSTTGVLVPNVALTTRAAAAPVTNPAGGALANGTLVWNTATTALGTTNDVTPGFYYWDGSVWVSLAGNNSKDWSTTGNYSTTAGTNFLGTKDAIDFRIKTNNTDRWNISNANSGQLQSYSLGTASLPIYSFQADTDTGLFSSGANTLNFGTNGTEKARIDTNGTLAIGTTSPNSSAILDVSSSSKGVSFPNVNLTSETDASTITSPVVGLMVYNTNTALPCGKGLYFNNGTAAAPIWACFTKTKREYHAYNSAGRNNVNNSTRTLQPGCTITFTVPTGQIADVNITAIIGALNQSTTSGEYSTVEAIIYCDGTFLPQGGWNRFSVVNPGSNTNAFNTSSFTTVWNGVTAGTHTIALYTDRYSGNSSVNIGGNCTTDVGCGEVHATVNYR